MSDRPEDRRPDRVPLSTDRVVSAAVVVVDTDGEAAFTMRRVGAALDVQAMSIYRYFTSRRTLLDAVAETVARRTAADLSDQLAPGDGWRQYLNKLAHVLRRLTSTHPRLFLLIATHPAAAPWLRPPMRTAQWLNAFVRRLVDDRFSPAAAVAAYRQFSAFLLGYLLPEAAAHDSDLTRTKVSSGAALPVQPPETEPSPEATGPEAAGFEVAGFPRLTAVAALLGADSYTSDFRRGLTHVLDQLARLRRQ